jgi:hypothetical protein
MAKPKRARTVRRAVDSDVRKFREHAAKVYAFEAGGSSTKPIVLAAASQIEADAEGVPCPFCQATMRVLEHDAIEEQGRRLRRVSLICRGCHTPWQRFYTLAVLN